MKKIIRQILDDLKPAGPPASEISKDVPKLYEPPVSATPVEHHHNERAITLQDAQPGSPKIETLHLDPAVLPPLPQDLNNQTPAEDPAQRLKQLDFQAQKNKERIIG